MKCPHKPVNLDNETAHIFKITQMHMKLLVSFQRHKKADSCSINIGKLYFSKIFFMYNLILREYKNIFLPLIIHIQKYINKETYKGQKHSQINRKLTEDRNRKTKK